MKDCVDMVKEDDTRGLEPFMSPLLSFRSIWARKKVLAIQTKLAAGRDGKETIATHMAWCSSRLSAASLLFARNMGRVDELCVLEQEYSRGCFDSSPPSYSSLSSVETTCSW